jgi:pimeloyl-ACP methyl ester carboxylesterase
MNFMNFAAMTEASVHRWTAADGVELAYHDLGQGRPVVLLHGLFSDAQMNWIKFGNAQRIADAGFRVIMPDLRAHGLSATPHDPANYPPDVLVRDLIGLIAHLKLTDFDLGGFSLGSRTTIEAVIDGVRPGRAILAGTGVEVLTNWKRKSGFFIDAIDRFDEAHRGDPHWLSIQFMRTMKIDRTAARLLLQALQNDRTAADMIAAFTMPTLVVCGAEDEDNGSARELAEMLPDATYVQIPGTHMTSVTKPELGEAIAAFLSAHR